MMEPQPHCAQRCRWRCARCLGKISGKIIFLCSVFCSNTAVKYRCRCEYSHTCVSHSDTGVRTAARLAWCVSLTFLTLYVTLYYNYKA